LNQPDYTSEEMMTIAAARQLKDGMVCFVGIGLPSAAANLARLTHAPDVVLIYESGTIGTKPDVLPLSIGDGELAETAEAIVSVPEMFRYWLQGGRIDVGFLGAAQLDRYGNINTTVIGPYDRPKVRLPGAGGAPEIATLSGEVFIMLRQNPRALVEKLDFITSRELPMGERLSLLSAEGERVTVRGQIRSASGAPVAGAEVHVWQTADNGMYDVQDRDQPEGNMRGRFRTGEGGAYAFETVCPKSYSIPSDGPVGLLLRATGRHPNRPAHIHFMLLAPGHARLITHLFIAGDPYLASDAVFGVKPSLVVTPRRIGEELVIEHDFILAPR
jgi:acyl CoA:acetate/3-ketoacid CoA transferase beta subunit